LSDYSEDRAGAIEAIKEDGGPAILRRETEEPTAEPWNPTFVTVDHPCTVVVTSYRAEEVDGTLVQRRDRKVLMAADVAVEPSTSDALVIDGRVFQIVSVDPLQPAPGGVTVMYTVQARG
jgi:hypothetical protein